jgi:hypothetical protein
MARAERILSPEAAVPAAPVIVHVHQPKGRGVSIAINVLLTIVTAGLWLIPWIGFEAIKGFFRSIGNMLRGFVSFATSRTTWDVLSLGILPLIRSLLAKR